MDEIQKTLIEAGRKDLAQEYYLKIAVNSKAEQFYTKLEDRKDVDARSGLPSGVYSGLWANPAKDLGQKIG